MTDENDGRDLYWWMGKIDANVETLSETVDGLADDFRGFEKETRVHRESVETRLSTGNTKFSSFRERIEKLEIKNGIKNSSTFITWKWIVEKLWQPILIGVLMFIFTQVLK